MKLKTALIVEDNELARTMMTEVLKDENFTVRAYASASLFFAAECGDCGHCPGPCVDVLLTDNHMPEILGVEFLEQLKLKGCKIPDHRKAILSGNWTATHLERAKPLDCKIFHKPVPLTEMCAWLAA